MEHHHFFGSTGAPVQTALQRFSFLQKGSFHIFPAAKLECEKLRAAKLSTSPLHHPCQGDIHFLRSLILSVFSCQAKVIELASNLTMAFDHCFNAYTDYALTPTFLTPFIRRFPMVSNPPKMPRFPQLSQTTKHIDFYTVASLYRWAHLPVFSPPKVVKR
jgi:hypothetical protein